MSPVATSCFNFGTSAASLILPSSRAGHCRLRRRPSSPRDKPSRLKGFEPIPTPRALETAEIPGIVEQYAQAARNAFAAGFDCRGGACRQWLSDRSIPARPDQQAHRPLRRQHRESQSVLAEVVDAVSAAVGAERTGVRISPQNTQNDIADSNPQALFNYVAEQLSGRGLAYLHIIEGDTSGVPVPSFDYTKLKRLFGGIVIANNGFDKAHANEGSREGAPIS